MAGQGDYVIVAIPFDHDWVVWGGGLDKWGPFGQERRFETRQDAEPYLKDARRDAEHQCLGVGNAVYVARTQVQQLVLRGVVYHDGQEILVDFSDDDLTPRQMRELGVL